MKIAQVVLFLASTFVAACGNNNAQIQQCTPTNACTCTAGTQRDTACTCSGGASCAISGDSIEFQCDGNADCNLTCGTDCLITCPGTTSCTVDVDDNAVVECPGTASCDVTCRGNCTVDISGNADAIVRCLDQANGAVCTVNGCSTTDCGNGVSACRTTCP